MEATLLLPIPEQQIIGLARQMTPNGKQTLLRTLIPGMDEVDRLLTYGDQRIRAIAVQRGIEWDALGEDERMQMIDAIKHEGRNG